MQAVVLVGGFGTRLRPLTNVVPKSMLPIAHVPLIARLIRRLELGGVDRATLALGFLPEPFVEAFPDGRCGGVALDYAIEPEPLDTAGAIRFAADHSGIDDTFVVANGDVLTDLSVAALVAAHRESGAEATIHLIGVDDPSAFGVVERDADGRVVRFVEKPPPGTEPSNLINAGTYVFEPEVLARIPGGQAGLHRARHVPAGRRRRSPPCAGDRRLLDRRRSAGHLPASQPRPHHRGAAGEGAGDRSGRRRGGDGVDPRRRRSAMARPSAMVRRCAGRCSCREPMSARGAFVEDSIVAGVIGQEARLSRTVVGADAKIADREQLHDARVPSD